MKSLTRVGISVTVIWVLAFVVLLVVKRSSLGDLAPNAWGDLLAGAVAPLTLFWLVLGYLQQGEELRQNTEAIKAQQLELQNQVRETASLVRNAERQAAASEHLADATRQELEREKSKAESELLPNFCPEGGRGNGAETNLDIQNLGQTVKRIAVVSPAGIGITISPSELFQRNSKGTMRVLSATNYPFEFTVKFTDLRNDEREQRYEMISQFTFISTDGA